MTEGGELAVNIETFGAGKGVNNHGRECGIARKGAKPMDILFQQRLIGDFRGDYPRAQFARDFKLLSAGFTWILAFALAVSKPQKAA